MIIESLRYYLISWVLVNLLMVVSAWGSNVNFIRINGANAFTSHGIVIMLYFYALLVVYMMGVVS